MPFAGVQTLPATSGTFQPFPGTDKPPGAILKNARVEVGWLSCRIHAKADERNSLTGSWESGKVRSSGRQQEKQK